MPPPSASEGGNPSTKGGISWFEKKYEQIVQLGYLLGKKGIVPAPMFVVTQKNMVRLNR